jgi:predicted NBD/HSP70 family sugar kinase
VTQRKSAALFLFVSLKTATSLGEILHALLIEGPQPTPGALAHVAGLSEPTARKWVGKKTGGAATLAQDARLTVLDESGYRLGPGLGLMLAFSVGGEHLAAGLVDAAGNVHCHSQMPPEVRQLRVEPEVFLERLRALGLKVLKEGLAKTHLVTPAGPGAVALRVIGATVAWPLPMDRDTLPDDTGLSKAWHDKTMRQHLSDALGLPVSRCHAMNDANAGALNVAFDQGTAGGVGSVICVMAASGVGVGTVHQALGETGRLPFIDAHLITGRRGIAGELGHRHIDKALVTDLNVKMAARRRKSSPAPEDLDPDRHCVCGAPDATGHLAAVVGAEATLERLGRYEPGDSLVARLAAMHKETGKDIRIKLALNHVGQAIARSLDSAVAVIDPAVISVAGALACEEILNGMRERRSAGDLNHTVKLERYGEPRNSFVGLRGAALAVLRAALYRGFFDHPAFQTEGHDEGPWERWSGWDHDERSGAQTGETATADAWEYHPLRVDDDFVNVLETHRHPNVARSQRSRRRSGTASRA